VRADLDGMLSNPLITRLLDSFPEPVAILNQQRQIVLANDKMVAMLGRPLEQFVGMRPGEALGCIHARETEKGCGTSEACQVCGATRTILDSQYSHAPVSGDCHIRVRSAAGEAALDVRAWATPLQEFGTFTVFAFRDIGDEKRRAVLERTFFHDILNTAGGLQGLIRLCSDDNGLDGGEMTQLAAAVADELIEELRAGRDLLAAERGELVAELREVGVNQLLAEVHAFHSRTEVARDKRLPLPQVSAAATVWTDRVLFRRVLANLVRNAMEASAPGQTVTMGFELRNLPTFFVHNQSAMTKEVQLQIFQRSFTTKPGRGRGVGTYSTKLLTERYLGGAVTFTSSPGEGTTFFIALPG
jgi:signal transduction histidine kinase